MFRETRKSSSPPLDKMTFHDVCKFVTTCVVVARGRDDFISVVSVMCVCDAVSG